MERSGEEGEGGDWTPLATASNSVKSLDDASVRPRVCPVWGAVEGMSSVRVDPIGRSLVRCGRVLDVTETGGRPVFDGTSGTGRCGTRRAEPWGVDVGRGWDEYGEGAGTRTVRQADSHRH